MSKEYVSKTSVEIKATPQKIWEALIKPEIAKEYFFGAEITTDWKVGSPIKFKGEYNGNSYEEKGIILNVEPNIQLQYSHWSHFDGLPDLPEHYRTWTFDITQENDNTTLAVSEDNIPTEKQKNRSDEFWNGVLTQVKQIVE
ncbi:SRPBCC domain-containing protein [Reichenbachiella versicolor]|uniref:SRPBCC domain-containing protein n=1 Tax=Reichenbachiella versicolor TaxID=1821036 RepID=UPI000D6E1AB7|nr:SRPBCC domain-containing protein [Reichenbachiella versicolor]